ncbi:hypothetical protein [Phyllobacterium meliloti]|uniref:hypothetical protein n=1 Tax=Phyllobacterium meliloti TaxID=555317 RepID=UPI001D1572EA|nr:hypothetical protein [Phyllobacterium sp. T1293]UGX86511.1 hypothetical protein LLE53_001140 [Phyllobacterium sp. T1293]
MAFGPTQEHPPRFSAPVLVSSSDEEESCHKMSPFFPRSISAMLRKPNFSQPAQKVTLCSPLQSWFERHLCPSIGYQEQTRLSLPARQGAGQGV